MHEFFLLLTLLLNLRSHGNYVIAKIVGTKQYKYFFSRVNVFIITLVIVSIYFLPLNLQQKSNLKKNDKSACIWCTEMDQYLKWIAVTNLAAYYYQKSSFSSIFHFFAVSLSMSYNRKRLVNFSKYVDADVLNITCHIRIKASAFDV